MPATPLRENIPDYRTITLPKSRAFSYPKDPSDAAWYQITFQEPIQSVVGTPVVLSSLLPDPAPLVVDTATVTNDNSSAALFLTGGSSLATYTIRLAVMTLHGDILNVTVTMTMAAAFAVPGPPPPPPPVYSDGFSGAPAGTAIQHPNYLATYAYRPPWKVAGIDYPVGIPAAKTLIDWQTMTPSVYLGLTLNTTTSLVRFDGVSVVLDGIDFSLHGGADFYFAGCPSITFTNCVFGGANYAALSNAIINADAASANLTVKNCVMDGGGAGTGACLISWPGSGAVVLQYNWFKHFPQQVIEIINSASLDYRFNLIENGGYQPGSHLNSLQWSSGTATAPVVEYNTVMQTATVPGAGEAFQFYMNSSGIMSNPTCSNNTLIANTTTPGHIEVSYFLHGHAAGTGPTTLTGAATVKDNYFDLSAAYGAFYAGSFPGWTASGNIDMNSGATLVPA